jgi:hypothetical protein
MTKTYHLWQFLVFNERHEVVPAHDGDATFAGVAHSELHDGHVTTCVLNNTYAKPDDAAHLDPCGGVNVVRGVRRGGRAHWGMGRTYAVQPGRGVKQVARIRLTSIRCERVDAISEDDVACEGLRWSAERNRWLYGERALETADDFPVGHVAAYWYLWRSMYPKSHPDDLVWALGFEVCEATD